jgi:adenylate kinase
VRVAVTGTPGTGKTTAVERVETGLPVVHLNNLIREEGLHEGADPDRGSLYADLEALAERVPAHALVESHLAHRLDSEFDSGADAGTDRVIVFRCHPEELARRLRGRGEPEPTVAENAESEALDAVLSEAVERHGPERVSEVETTDRTPEEAARAVEAILAGERNPGAGVGAVDYTGWL